ncbi:MAG: four helix bundle protein [Bacteroidetes bacterium]|nr:four helix bundle protein [Bacteroidota bacterium]
MSYKQLEVWQSARDISIAIHKMTMVLPKFEMYETGSQIRRSSKSVRTNIVEGYGRREYKQEFIRFIIFAIASNEETIDHLETLFETGSLTDESTYKELHNKIYVLSKQLNNF